MKITQNVKLPPDAMKHHWAVLGITGSGKSYAVRGVVEKRLKAHERVGDVPNAVVFAQLDRSDHVPQQDDDRRDACRVRA